MNSGCWLLIIRGREQSSLLPFRVGDRERQETPQAKHSFLPFGFVSYRFSYLRV